MGVSEKTLIGNTVNRDGILELIPQRAPIVMVDSFHLESNGTCVTELHISKDNIFCDGTSIQECGIVEHIAQSAAARLGHAFVSKDLPVPIGYIGSVDKMKIQSLPLIGELINTRLTVIQELLGITLINAEVYCNNIIVAECRMKIFIDENC